MKLCIPIKKIADFKKAQKLGDMVEVWFFDKLLNERTKPVICKIQSVKDLTQCLPLKPEYIDLDIKTPQKLIQKVKKLSPKTKIILSFHDFKRTPSDKTLKTIAQKLHKKGADIIKIATHAQTFTDSLRMLAFLKELTSMRQRRTAICLCMGREGQITRLAGHLFGNYLTYAALTPKDKTAEGQLTIKELGENRVLTSR